MNLAKQNIEATQPTHLLFRHIDIIILERCTFCLDILIFLMSVHSTFNSFGFAYRTSRETIALACGSCADLRFADQPGSFAELRLKLYPKLITCL